MDCARIAKKLCGQVYADTSDLDVRQLGSRGPAVPIFCLGGQAAIENGTEAQARSVFKAAIDAGVRYIDTANIYGPSQERLGKFFVDVDEDLFVATKSAERTKSNFLMEIETSVEVLGRIPDVAHIHSVTKGEASQIVQPGGALEGALQAKAEGLCHHIGLTSHDSPDDMCQIIRRCDDIDIVMVALNPADTRFAEELIPLCNERGIGVVAMKVMARGLLVRPTGPGVKTASEAMRFALSCPGVDAAVVGISYPEEVKELAEVCEDFEPMEWPEARDLVQGTAPYAQELMFYRSEIRDWETPPDMRPSPDWYAE